MPAPTRYFRTLTTEQKDTAIELLMEACGQLAQVRSMLLESHPKDNSNVLKLTTMINNAAAMTYAIGAIKSEL